jgi:hypothetical protein
MADDEVREAADPPQTHPTPRDHDEPLTERDPAEAEIRDGRNPTQRRIDEQESRQ